MSNTFIFITATVLIIFITINEMAHMIGLLDLISINQENILSHWHNVKAYSGQRKTSKGYISMTQLILQFSVDI